MAPQLKEIYHQKFFSALNLSLKSSYPKFNQQKFLDLIFDHHWQARELKQRMRHISHCLGQTLTNSYSQNIEILKQTAKSIDLEGDKMSGLSLVIFADYVEVFGLDNLETSLNALEFFTPYGSSEFAIRHFLVKYEKQTLEKLHQWAESDNYHIRRLASEGSRPRLPWGIALQKFKQNPTPIIPILEVLKNDQSEYVRRSVANNLNDIAKDNPDVALNLVEKWLQNSNPNLNRLVKHGARGLLKKGDKRALVLFGIKNHHKFRVESFDLQKTTVKIGEDLIFSLQLTNPQSKKIDSKIRLEYAIYFLMNNGKYSKKVFQISEKYLDKGNFIFKKTHSFRKISTRKYYVGEHKIALILNGEEVKTNKFNLQ